MKIIIAEDSKENAEVLTILLSQMNFVDPVIDISEDLESTFELLKSNVYDLAFLDIQFKKGTIFEILDRILEEDTMLPEIVFVTAHSSYEYALKGIQLACLDFINKPISNKELKISIDKYKKKKSLQQNSEKQIRLLLKVLKEDLNYDNEIAIPLPNNKIEYSKISDLICLTAEGPVCRIKLKDNNLISVKPLAHYISLFVDFKDMIQVSRFQLVNLKNLKSYNKNSRKITMIDGSEIQASHRMARNLRGALTDIRQPRWKGKIEELWKKLIS